MSFQSYGFQRVISFFFPSKYIKLIFFLMLNDYFDVLIIKIQKSKTKFISIFLNKKLFYTTVLNPS
jgi:hypothetical protein